MIVRKIAVLVFILSLLSYAKAEEPQAEKTSENQKTSSTSYNQESEISSEDVESEARRRTSQQAHSERNFDLKPLLRERFF